ncbi:hypothetical protein QQG91_06330 [Marivivens sp. LCG002]|uniref:hypothetical protein n=1 Tax=Marivivens sp. LCG002 TaxID=3051171 RepID=UPI0025529A4C|nr:hypothetical protein [Marivivens sp. LCG002]WIV52053.1 hypothetical protein QQG91_06330 [Marivivens sp. LCG002]
MIEVMRRSEVHRIGTTLLICLLGNTAAAESCQFVFLQTFISAQRVDFTEDQSSAELTLREPAVGDPITIELNREIVTEVDKATSFSMLIGSTTIKSGKITNEINVSIQDPKSGSKIRLFGINYKNLIEGLNPEEGFLGGTMYCNQ